jgi:tetratricopeptide (TPR) repeat protein
MRALRLGAAALLVAAVVVAFSPAFDAGFVNWDDDYVLVGNPHFRGFDRERVRWMFTNFLMGHYQPLAWLTFAADHALWGMNPRGYHAVNVALHAANTVLVHGLAAEVLALGGGPPGGALLAALLFGIHPLRVEAVVWATERRDVLSVFLALLATLAWIRWAKDGRRVWYAASLAAFALSLLANAWTMTLPAVLFALDLWPLRRRGRSLARLVVEQLPFLAVSLANAAVAYVAAGRAGGFAESEHLSLAQHVAVSAWGLVFYVRKSLLPTRLYPAYLLDHQLDPLAPAYLGSAILVAALAGLLLARHRRWPGTLTAFASYAILVSPVIGLVQSGVQIAADRYVYLSGIPLAILAGAGLARLPRGAAVPIVVLLGILTWRQARVWHDSVTLWSQALAVDPGNWLARNGRGLARQEAGDTRGALEDFDVVVRERPTWTAALNNRGQARLASGDTAGALADWDRALALDPRFFDALLNRGAARLLSGDARGAVADLEAAVAVAPGSALAWFDLASAHAVQGDVAAGIEDCRRALAAGPDAALRARIERKLAALRDVPPAGASMKPPAVPQGTQEGAP